MRGRIDETGLDLILRKARSHNGWTPERVAETVVRQMYDLMKMGPTSVNSCPARFVFVMTPEGKERLKPAMIESNLPKTMAAPVTAIIGYDTQFYELLPELMPYRDARPLFAGKPALIEETAFRNSTLQGAYLMMAARSLGLDVGPMSGFDAAKVNAEFWPGGRIKANFICNIGFGDDSKIFDKLPRLAFEKVCQIA